MYQSLRSIAPGLVLAVAFLLPAAMPAAQDNRAPDNTAVNKRDRDTSQPTADQGGNKLSDREMQAHIRREVVRDKNLSTDGHNAKIIAKNGKVTLRGPVRSEDEKRAIEDHARKYAGDGNVDDQLTVKEDHK